MFLLSNQHDQWLLSEVNCCSNNSVRLKHIWRCVDSFFHHFPDEVVWSIIFSRSSVIFWNPIGHKLHARTYCTHNPVLQDMSVCIRGSVKMFRSELGSTFRSYEEFGKILCRHVCPSVCLFVHLSLHLSVNNLVSYPLFPQSISFLRFNQRSSYVV